MAGAKATARVAPDMVPHPLYVELQKQSPMGMMRDYTIREFDDAVSPINAMTFYRDFVSKSLPAVFRNDAEKWPFYQLVTKWI
jgi:hypothetical protein